MKKFLLSATAFLVLAWGGPVSAADMPTKGGPVVAPPPPFNWTGLYLGVNGGCGTKNETASAAFEDIDPGEGSPFPFTNSHTGGCFGGVQLGYNYQFVGTPWVIGIEGDWQWGRMRNRGSVAELEPGEVEPLALYTSDLRQFGTLRGRLGYAVPNPPVPLLLYVTGGWAWGKNRVEGIAPDLGLFPGTFFSDNKQIDGWTAGAGIEAAIDRYWSVKFEYLYLDFGSNTYNFFVSDDGATPGALQLSTKVHTVRLGVNYRFGNWFLGKAPAY